MDRRQVPLAHDEQNLPASCDGSGKANAPSPENMSTCAALRRGAAVRPGLRAINHAQSHSRCIASLFVAPFHAIIAGFPFPHSS